MILWFRHLPKISMDLSEWTPFIQNNWFRKHYLKFVYLLQITIFLISVSLMHGSLLSIHSLLS